MKHAAPQSKAKAEIRTSRSSLRQDSVIEKMENPDMLFRKVKERSPSKSPGKTSTKSEHLSSTFWRSGASHSSLPKILIMSSPNQLEALRNQTVNLERSSPRPRAEAEADHARPLLLYLKRPRVLFRRSASEVDPNLSPEHPLRGLGSVCLLRGRTYARMTMCLQMKVSSVDLSGY